MKYALCIDGLCKRYPGKWRQASTLAVDEVSLEVESGEAFGFVGPNGAGKSTTIKILTGVLSATSGKAAMFDVPVSDPKARMGVGYVPESPYLYDYLTPLEILSMSARLHGLRIGDEHAHCMRWLERLELGAVANKTIRSFSKGMTQRVALAQALCIKPKLLILDEPLSGLDPIGRRDVVDILSEYKKTGGTLFFTSHVLHDVERLADRFGLIHRGKLRAVRSPAELVGVEETVVVRSTGSLPVEGMADDFAGRWQGEIARSDLWSLLERLRQADHVILEIKPSLSLENAFMRAIGES